MTILRKGKGRVLRKKFISTIAYFKSTLLNGCQKEPYCHPKTLYLVCYQYHIPAKLLKKKQPTSLKFLHLSGKGWIFRIFYFFYVCATHSNLEDYKSENSQFLSRLQSHNIVDLDK